MSKRSERGWYGDLPKENKDEQTENFANRGKRSGNKVNSNSAKCSSNKGKGNKGSNRRNRSNNWRGNPPDGDTRYSPDNALSWYTRYASLTNATANVPFPNRPGMTINMGSVAIPTSSNVATRVQKNAYYGIPGVLAMEWMPVYGYNNGNDSQNPLTVAANETYARIRSNFSGDLSVDPPDIMIYELALDSVYMLIAKYKKIFRLLNAFTPDNYVIPNGVLRAMRFTDAQIALMRKQKVEIWKIINTLVHEARKFRCPGFMDVMNRHYWLSDNVYTDAETINSQFYIFNLVGYYKLVQPATVDDVLTLTLESSQSSNYGTTDIASAMYNECHALINAIASWDDSYTINGYLLRAYDPNDFFTVDEITYEDELTPVYSLEVLTQIENSKALYAYGSVDRGASKITYSPATNILSHTPTMYCAAVTSTSTYSSLWLTSNLLPTINIHSDIPGAGDVVIATRLQPTFGPATVTSAAVTIPIYAGTEILTHMYLCAYEYTSTGFAWQTYDYYSVVGSYLPANDTLAGNMAQVGTNLRVVAFAESFRMRPIQMCVIAETPSDVPNGVVHAIPMGDIHNLTVISKEQLQQITRICVLSELNAYSN